MQSEMRLASNYQMDILRYCNVKYGPYDKNGNRVYLYDIDSRLLSVFLKAVA